MSIPELDQQISAHPQTETSEHKTSLAAELFRGDITANSLLESLTEGVVVVDHSGTIVLVNSRAEQMFGYPANELTGKQHSVLIPEHLRKYHNAHEDNFFKEHRNRPMGQMLNLSGCRKDGTEFPLEISLCYINGASGPLVLALVSDITERKHLQNELSSKVEQLEATLAKIKRLEGIIPICMHCKKIRDDKESWQKLENYISEHSEALFSHGICPDCAKIEMEKLEELKQKRKEQQST
jgi:PAS domain S-box-containing protein